MVSQRVDSSTSLGGGREGRSVSWFLGWRACSLLFETGNVSVWKTILCTWGLGQRSPIPPQGSGSDRRSEEAAADSSSANSLLEQPPANFRSRAWWRRGGDHDLAPVAPEQEGSRSDSEFRISLQHPWEREMQDEVMRQGCHDDITISMLVH